LSKLYAVIEISPSSSAKRKTLARFGRHQLPCPLASRGIRRGERLGYALVFTS